MAGIQDRALQAQREVEQLFAGAVYINAEWARQDAGWLQPDLLVDDRVRRFWSGVLAGESPIEYAYACNLMPDILGWSNDVVSFLGVRDYASQIVKQAYLAKVGGALGRLAKGVQEGDIDAVQSLIEGLDNDKPIAPGARPTARLVHDDFVRAVEEKNRMIPSGIPGLDENTGGLERQTLSILAGRPSMGKTALALTEIVASLEAGLKASLFSMEMSKVSIWARLACRRAGLTWMDVRSGRITEQQKRVLIEQSKRLADRYGDRLLIYDQPGITTYTVWEAVAIERPDLVVADHLRLFADRGVNEVERLGGITSRMKALSKAYDCHVQILAQLNRGVEGREDKRPVMSDLRDSGKPEEDADLVMMLYREGYYKPELEEANPEWSETELWIRKFRDGLMNARIDIAFNKREQAFYPMRRKNLNASL